MVHACAAALGGAALRTGGRRLASCAPSSSLGQLLKFGGIHGSPPVVPAPRSVVLLVNTASHCGYTPQLKGLQALHVKYGARGLAVVGVPCNDFGAQEPDEEAKVLSFYTSTYGVTFPLTAKTAVLGAARHPVYARLEAQLGDAGVPEWNFSKFLVGRSGELAGLFPAGMEPSDPAVVAAIEAELGSRKRARPPRRCLRVGLPAWLLPLSLSSPSPLRREGKGKGDRLTKS